MADGDPQADRAEIDRRIAGQTLCHLYERNAREHAERPALNWKDDGGWQRRTWRQYRDAVAEAALGLASLGVTKGDFVALMLGNRPEHLIADGAVMQAAATSVSLYNTFAPEQVAYVAANCGARVAVLENRDYFKRWQDVRAELPALEHIVLVEDAQDAADDPQVLSWDDLLARGRERLRADSDALDGLWRELEPDDPATLIYTSGTTGKPKGVVITHRNVLWEMASIDRVHTFPLGGRTISYLPLAHVAERMFSHWLALQHAQSVYFCPEISRALEIVGAARPGAFLAVPRVWEKMHARLEAAVDAEANPRKRKIALKALQVGREAVRRERDGRPVPLLLRLQRRLFDRLVFAKIRQRLGLDECDFAVSGSAPISEDVLEFFAGIGLPIHEAYGMTETTAVTHANTPGAYRLGTVGRALPGVETRLADDGEVLVRGGNITPGYHDNPQATAETIESDGWLHTGDLGEIDDEGYLRIVGRKKELIITAGGKNIAPSHLEGLLVQHPLIGQACAVGDRRPYVAALVVLDPEAAPDWAQRHGVAYEGLASFAADERVVAEVQRAVDELNRRVSKVEQVKRFKILPTEWTAESEELTPTLKLKRRVIHEKYAADIEALYAR